MTLQGATLDEINAQIVECRRCPRLVAWREAAALNPPARFPGQHYWARPLPGFGDTNARVLIVGLAPAAHGGNRTGRMFTGDRSGDFLFAALNRASYASQPTSVARNDGLALQDMYVAAVNRCAPPANKPTPDERDNCLPYLTAEIAALKRLEVIVCLGAYAWDGTLRALAAPSRPKFGHGSEAAVAPYRLIGSFHPSQQNTFTGRLTPRMLDDVFARARLLTGTAATGTAAGAG